MSAGPLRQRKEAIAAGQDAKAERKGEREDNLQDGAAGLRVDLPAKPFEGDIILDGTRPSTKGQQKQPRAVFLRQN